MTAPRRSTVFLGVAAVAAAGALLGVVVPGHAEAARLRDRCASLEAEAARLPERTAEVESLADEYDRLRRRLERDRRTIPGRADTADLVRRLSLPEDGTSVHDQTFAASTSTHATPGDDASPQVVPLTVEMEARFDAIFALLRAAETMDRLVRVASVRISSDPERGTPRCTATVALEAVFDPRAGQEGP